MQEKLEKIIFKVVKKDSIKLNLSIPARSFYDIIFNNFMITYGQSYILEDPFDLYRSFCVV